MFTEFFSAESAELFKGAVDRRRLQKILREKRGVLNAFPFDDDAANVDAENGLLLAANPYAPSR